MNTTSRTHWALPVIVACVPFAGVIAVRTIAGVGGPQAAMGAETGAAAVAPDAQASTNGQSMPMTRKWVLSPSDAERLHTVGAEHLQAWTTPLFPVVDAASTDPVAETPRIAQFASPAPPVAARYADMFHVSSLMSARDGAVAVIDRKLRRIGDDLGNGVIVETIDLEARLVVVRTPEGLLLERRPNR